MTIRVLGIPPGLSDSVHRGWALRIFTSKKFSAGANAADPGMAFGEPVN